jgi:hypothetical protein
VLTGGAATARCRHGYPIWRRAVGMRCPSFAGRARDVPTGTHCAGGAALSGARPEKQSRPDRSPLIRWFSRQAGIVVAVTVA